MKKICVFYVMFLYSNYSMSAQPQQPLPIQPSAHHERVAINSDHVSAKDKCTDRMLFCGLQCCLPFVLGLLGARDSLKKNTYKPLK